MVISYSGKSNTLTLYINGSKIKDYNNTSGLKSFEKIQVVLGNDLDIDDKRKECIVNNADQGFFGAIHGLYVWNKKLPDEQVRNLFKGVDKNNDMLIKWSDFSATDDVKRQLFIS